MHYFRKRMKKGAGSKACLTKVRARLAAGLRCSMGPLKRGIAAGPLAVSEEGQRAAQLGKTRAHPNVKPLEKVRPAIAHILTMDYRKEFPKYEKLWKEGLQIQ
jgi:hypothetical protein